VVCTYSNCVVDWFYTTDNTTTIHFCDLELQRYSVVKNLQHQVVQCVLTQKYFLPFSKSALAYYVCTMPGICHVGSNYCRVSKITDTKIQILIQIQIQNWYKYWYKTDIQIQILIQIQFYSGKRDNFLLRFYKLLAIKFTFFAKVWKEKFGENVFKKKFVENVCQKLFTAFTIQCECLRPVSYKPEMKFAPRDVVPNLGMKFCTQTGICLVFIL
jgi:hypothetical protein